MSVDRAFSRGCPCHSRTQAAAVSRRGAITSNRRVRTQVRLLGCSNAHYSCRFVATIAVLISTGLGDVRCYEIYEDGSIGQPLPGSASDPRGLPNSPFTVDGNRLSDGVSSVSPLSTTGPSFPLYRNGSIDDSGNEPARQWANLTMTSRLEQGVSPRGAGSFETTVSKYRVLQGDYATEKPSASFSVHAWERWNPSAFAIQEGETYSIGVGGEQYWQDGRIRADARGYATYYDAVDSCWASPVLSAAVAAGVEACPRSSSSCA